MRKIALVLALMPLPALAQSWCGASSLNATERAICSDPILGGLDGELNVLWSSQTRGRAERAAQKDWLVSRRNACGSDVFCIEEAYHWRLDELSGYAGGGAGGGHAEPLRLPWCGAASLGAAERAICSDDTLANLDAAMAAVYGATQASDGDWEQQQWLRGSRDACGSDHACIGAAYLSRITALGGRLRAN